MVFMYPAVFHKENGSYWVEFPDLEGCQTYGENLTETMVFAQEALAAYVITLLEQGKKLNEPSDIKKIEAGDNAFTTLVSCNVENYLKSSKAVKKTLTIPEWLNEMAVKEGINFSGALQNALLEQLHINK